MVYRKLILIDGNHLLYQCFFSRITGTLTTTDGRPSGAFVGFLRSYNDLRDQFPGSYYFVVFDEGYSGREQLLERYKSSAPKPESLKLQVRHVKRFLRYAGVPIFFRRGLEADDIIGVACNEWLCWHAKNSVCIVSTDRDYFQLVSDRVLVYDYRAKVFFGPEEVKRITGVYPQYYLWYKCLLGDRSDKIAGIRGFGKKKAAKFAINGKEGLTQEQRNIFERNEVLMRIPRLFTELPFLPPHRAKRYNRELKRSLEMMIGSKLAVDSGRVAAYLQFYECTF